MNIYQIHSEILSQIDVLEYGSIEPTQIQSTLNSAWDIVFNQVLLKAESLPKEKANIYLYETLPSLIQTSIEDVDNTNVNTPNVFEIKKEGTKRILFFDIDNGGYRKKAVEIREDDAFAVYNDPFRTPTLSEDGAIYFVQRGYHFQLLLPVGATVNNVNVTVLNQPKALKHFKIIKPLSEFIGKGVCASKVLYNGNYFYEGHEIDDFNSKKLEEGIVWENIEHSIPDNLIQTVITQTAQMLLKNRQGLYSSRNNN